MKPEVGLDRYSAGTTGTMWAIKAARRRLFDRTFKP